jgi:hypothetical protein
MPRIFGILVAVAGLGYLADGWHSGPALLALWIGVVVAVLGAGGFVFTFLTGQ